MKLKKNMKKAAVKPLLPLVLLASLGAPFATSFAALANDPYAKIIAAQQKGRYPEALSQVGDLLQSNADDPQALLLKGNINKLMGNVDNATAIFKELINKHPDMPEPYNNLAVLYADQGKPALAIETLQQVFSTSSSYGTAYQNLRALYNHMASSAYREALDIKQKPKQQSQYAMLNKIDTYVGYAPVPASASTGVAVAAVSGVDVAAAAQSSSSRKSGDMLGDITNMVAGWSQAWSKQNVKDYLSYYHKDFVPPKSMSRRRWERDRKIRLGKPKYIKIDVIGLSVLEQKNNTAMVMFEQHYRSDTYSDTVVKQLKVKKHKGKWQIVQENVL